MTSVTTPSDAKREAEAIEALKALSSAPIRFSNDWSIVSPDNGSHDNKETGSGSVCGTEPYTDRSVPNSDAEQRSSIYLGSLQMSPQTSPQTSSQMTNVTPVLTCKDVASRSTAAEDSDEHQDSIVTNANPSIKPLVKPKGGWKGWKKKLEAELADQDARLSSTHPSPKQWWASYVSSSISRLEIRQNRKASKVTVGFRLPQLVINIHLAQVHWDDQKKRSDPTFWSVKCFTISSFKEVQHKTFEECFLHREGRKRTKGFADFVATLGLKDTETDDLLKKIKTASLQNYEQCKQEQREYENAILEQTRLQGPAASLMTES